jgi:serine/threonine protein kinase
MYQIGVTLYRLCNGDDILKEQIPYSDSDLQRQIVAGRFPNRNMFLPHIPRRLKTIIRRLLNTDQQKRYDSIIDLQNDLGQVNTLLDWQYSKTEGTLRWQKRTLYHTYTIEIVQRKPHNWFIDGYTTSSTTGRKRRRNLWCTGPFTTEKKAINDASRIFREMEAR